MSDELDTPDLERRLSETRPLPSAGYRSRLRSELLEQLRIRPAAPRRLRFVIAAYATSGAALLVVAAVGVAGAGPFAA
jgi:hypothetical protein